MNPTKSNLQCLGTALSEACSGLVDFLLVAVIGIIGSFAAVLLVAAGCVLLIAMCAVVCGLALVAAGPAGSVLAAMWGHDLVNVEDEP
jgi:hypothetical protein